MRGGKIGALLAAAALLLLASVAIAAGGSFGVSWWTVDGGGGTSSGGDYALSGTAGQADAGPLMRGSAYELAGGFWGVRAGREYDVYLPTILRSSP